MNIPTDSNVKLTKTMGIWRTITDITNGFETGNHCTYLRLSTNNSPIPD